MKLLVFITYFVCSIATPGLSEVRSLYMSVSENEEATKQLHDQLDGVKENDSPALLAYKGAVMTMMAKYTKKKGEKLSFFKGGAALIEAAVAAEPSNIEIRTIRLSIQENAPKFLRYHKNRKDDKQLITTGYSKIQSKEIQTFVKYFVMQSGEFSEAEKSTF